ncbi:hypothetical protein GW17_00038957 [Ensete ventricosum]|nr:hypothetical protein GW17_00038957 [Ensete ventricosum]
MTFLWATLCVDDDCPCTGAGNATSCDHLARKQSPLQAGVNLYVGATPASAFGPKRLARGAMLTGSLPAGRLYIPENSNLNEEGQVSSLAIFTRWGATAMLFQSQPKSS